MKIQNYTKSIKIKSQQLSWGKKKKKAEVLGHFSRTYHTSTSVAQWWKHCCIWGLCLLVRKSCASSDWASVHEGSVHDCGVSFFLFLKSRWASVAFCPSLTGFTCSTEPTHPQTLSQLLFCSHWCRLFFFLSNNWRKRKKRGIHNQTFFFFFLNVSLAYSCPSLFFLFLFLKSHCICSVKVNLYFSLDFLLHRTT